MVEELLSKRGSAGSGVFTNDLSANGRQQLEGKFLAVNVPQPHFQVCVRVVVGVSKESIRSGEMRPWGVAVVPVISVAGSGSPEHPARRPTARNAAAAVISAAKNWEAIRTLTTPPRNTRAKRHQFRLGGLLGSGPAGRSWWQRRALEPALPMLYSRRGRPDPSLSPPSREPRASERTAMSIGTRVPVGRRHIRRPESRAGARLVAGHDRYKHAIDEDDAPAPASRTQARAL